MNWGWKIILVYSAFVVGMLTLVFKAKSEKVELVAPDYYAQEVAYQHRMNALSNANALSSKIIVAQNADGVLLTYPKELLNGAEGNITLYRPSDSSLDKQVVLAPTAEATQLIASNDLSAGLYTVKVAWKQNDKEYYFEDALIVQK